MRKFFRRLFRRRKPVMLPKPLTLSHATHIKVLAVHMAQATRYR